MPVNPLAADTCELVATAVAAKTANTATETAPTTKTGNDLGSMRLLIVNPSEAPTLQRALASAEPAYRRSIPHRRPRRRAAYLLDKNEVLALHVESCSPGLLRLDPRRAHWVSVQQRLP